MSDKNYQTETKILKGTNVLEQLCDECLSLGDKVMIVFSENMIKQSGLYARVVSLLNICGIDHVTYECEGTTYEEREIKNAVDLGRKEGAQLVVAIGDNELMCFSKVIARQCYGEKTILIAEKTHLPIINISSFLNLDDKKTKISNRLEQSYHQIQPATLFVDFEY